MQTWPLAVHRDGSLRWLAVHFPADVAGSERATFRLRPGLDSPPPEQQVRVSETPTGISVENGALGFTVNKRPFLPLAGTRLGDRPALGRTVRLFSTRAGDDPCWAEHDPQVRVAVEQAGPLHAVIRAEGRFCRPSGEQFLDFVLRVGASAGSRLVTLTLTFINREAPPAGPRARWDEPASVSHALSALGIELPLEPCGSLAARWQRGTAEFPTAAPALEPPVEVAMAHGGWRSQVGGYQVTGPAGQTVERSEWGVPQGFLDVRDGDTGVMVGVREFWHHAPKALGVDRERLSLANGMGWGNEVWLGNRWDAAHALALQFVRTGKRSYGEAMAAAARHTMDVDVIHHCWDPAQIGGLHGLCNRHTEGSPSTMNGWIEGLLDYHLLTADPRALEVARLAGEYLARVVLDRDGPFLSNVRGSGIPMISLAALYEVTGETRYLEAACEYACELLRNQTVAGGAFVAPDYPDTAIAAPWKTGLALSGLIRVWRLTGEERLKTGFLAGCEWLITEGVNAEGIPYYYSPYDLRISLPQTEAIAVEPLADAWELTGDRRYLEVGRRVWRHVLQTRGPLTPSIPADWDVVAPIYRVFLWFLAACEEAGELEDAP